MNAQALESFGWLMLIIQIPILILIFKLYRIILKTTEIIIHKISYINILKIDVNVNGIFYLMPYAFFQFFYIFSNSDLFLKANYSPHLSLFLSFSALIAFSIDLIVTQFLPKYLKIKYNFLPNFETALGFFIWSLELFYIGIYFKKYIFLISFCILFSLSFVKLLSNLFLKNQEISSSRIEEFGTKFKDITLIMPIFSILFVMKSFGFYDIFGMIDATSLHWLYSAIAQVFSALLGILVMVGIFSLSSTETENKVNNRRQLLDALKGFTILFLVVILISILGISFVHESDNASGITSNYVDLRLDTLIPPKPIGETNLPETIQIFNSMIFTLLISLVISSFIYLYELIRIMLEKENSKRFILYMQ